MNAPTKMLDTRLSLTWLLSSAAAVIIALTGFALNQNSTADRTQAKLDAVILSISKLEKRADDRDTRTDTLKEMQYSLQRTADQLELRVGSLERSQRK